jgi:hypothetical protein
MATTTNDKGKGGQNLPGEEGYPPPKFAANLPEGTVISPLGITRPPEPGILDPYRKERSDDEQLAGKVLISGKTHHGFKYERIVEITQPRTELGMFQVFKAHFPDAVDEDFSAKPVSDEEADKLEKDWAAELQGQEKEARDKRDKEYAESTGSKAREKDAEDYDALTVAELRERAGTRGIEHKHDWVKDDYVKALKKGK